MSELKSIIKHTRSNT